MKSLIATRTQRPGFDRAVFLMDIEKSPVWRLIVAGIASIGIHAYLLTIPLAPPLLAINLVPTTFMPVIAVALPTRGKPRETAPQRTTAPTLTTASSASGSTRPAPTVTDEELPGIPLEIPQQDRYLHRQELNLAPRLLAPIVVPYPEQVQKFGKFHAILSLYLNEIGNVDRVEVDSSDLSLEQLKETIQTFRRAHFSPGEKDGTPVKSRLRIEVLFDSGEN